MNQSTARHTYKYTYSPLITLNPPAKKNLRPGKSAGNNRRDFRASIFRTSALSKAREAQAPATARNALSDQKA